MKQFNLKEHLEHPDWEVVTREGRPVRMLCTDLDDNDYPVAAVVGNFHVDKYTAEGLFHAGKETKYDLFFASEKHEGWINLYKTAQDYIFPSYIYQTKEDAEKYGIDNDCYITTIKIEWEE